MDSDERNKRRKQRRELRRRQLEREKSARGSEAPVPPIDPDVEATLREERRLRRQEIVLARHDFATDPEVADFLDSVEFRRELDGLGKELNLEEKAQEIMFDGLLAPTFADALEFAEKAIRLDPDCVDARLILAAGLTQDSDEYLDLLYRAVWAGERWLGEDYFEECKGQFWTVATTRPYMRALYQLGVTLMRMGDELEAIVVFEEMVELNPDDDQGARLFLVSLHLMRRQLEQTRTLFETYADDLTGTAMWARVFERILDGDDAGAVARLDLARQWSPRVEALLFGAEGFQGEEPRDDDELAAYLLHAVLETHSSIAEWIRSHPK